MNNSPLMLLMALCIIVLTSCNSSEEIVENFNPVTEITSKSIEIDILNYINEYRTSKGFSKLEKLNVIKHQTNNHTNYMISVSKVSHDNFHERKDNLIKNANAVSVGENVAYGYTTAKTVVNAWLKSESHKKNIEGNFNYFEVSAEKDANGKWYYTNIFAKI